MSATVSVRPAAHGDVMTVLARWGLAARAAIYLLIGVLAIALARGSRRGETGQRGAIQELTPGTPAGRLWSGSSASASRATPCGA
jgi:hypothetical protein